MRAKEMVRKGYNAIAPTYLAARAKDSQDVRLLLDLVWRLPRGARVLDVGCGAGLPVTMQLGRYFDVVGVDLATGQLQLARRAVPGAQFACQDMAQLAFANASFDAVCSYYAIIHVPRAEHREVLANFHRVLRPGGLLLACMGAGDLPESVEECHGKPMYWSHFDAAANLAMLEDGEFSIEWQKIVPDATYPGASHLFVLARRR